MWSICMQTKTYFQICRKYRILAAELSCWLIIEPIQKICIINWSWCPWNNIDIFIWHGWIIQNIYFKGEASLSKYYQVQGLNNTRVTRTTERMTMTVPNIRSKIGRCSITYRGPNMWNSLPNDIYLIHNYNSFRNSMLKQLLPDYDNHPT